MGLGPHVAQRIAIAHGWWIDVESSEELGTTFQLHLPRSA
jgi:signal transduction histidine kinase